MFEGLSSRIEGTFSPGKISISDSQLRIIGDALTVCSNNIAKALSDMIKTSVDAALPSAKVISVSDIPEMLGSRGSPAAVMSNRIIGTSHGVIIMSSSLRDILRIADIFLHKQRGYFTELNGENISVIREFSDIVAGYYITALNGLLDAGYKLSASSIMIDPYRVIEKDSYRIIRDLGLCADSVEESNALVFETDFCIPEYGINMRTILLFKKEDVRNMVRIIESGKA